MGRRLAGGWWVALGVAAAAGRRSDLQSHTGCGAVQYVPQLASLPHIDEDASQHGRHGQHGQEPVGWDSRTGTRQCLLVSVSELPTAMQQGKRNRQQQEQQQHSKRGQQRAGRLAGGAL